MTGESENQASRDSLRVYNPAPIERSITRVIEQQTAKVSSPLFLVASMTSMLASFAFKLSGRQCS